MAVKCQGCCYAICFNLFYYHHLLCFLVIANYELLSIKTHTHTHTHTHSPRYLLTLRQQFWTFVKILRIYIYVDSFDKKKLKVHALARHKGNRPNEGRS
jgi:hypothetical protein